MPKAVRLALAPALGALALAPSLVLAQVANHQPVRVLKQGTTTKSVTAGSVTLQVFVTKTGHATVKRIIKSTNHADDAAAMDVARSAVYSPAKLDNKPSDEYYDFTVKFTNGGVAAAPSGSLQASEDLLRTNRFADAKSAFAAYLVAHPDDQRALGDLALSESYLGDQTSAASDFAKMTAIPEADKPAAATAFVEASRAASKGNDSATALSYAKKAVDLRPTYGTYATLGAASLDANDGAGAVAAYEHAKSLADDAKIDAKQRALIDQNLVAAYLAAGEPEKAKATLADAKALDPSVNVGAAFGQYYVKQARAKADAKDEAGAAALYLQAAEQDPTDAVTLYDNAAFAFLNVTPKPDDTSAKAAADKALALDPTDAAANFATAVTLAHTGHASDAIPFLNKADASAKAKGQTNLAKQIEDSLHNLSAAK